jgi:peptidoglycan/xylan/chitin deacetylase (PgdA/CDA1 family)
MTRRADAWLGAIGRLIWHVRLAPLVRYARRRSPKVLLYHACEPDDSAFTRGLGVTCRPDVFAAQLDHLSRHYRVVGLDELERGAPPGSVAITFDDGYRSVLEHAAPLLRERGLPAVVYLVTGVVDNRDAVWVNELNWLLNTYPDEVLPIAASAFDVPDASDPADVVGAAVARYDPAVVADVLATSWRSVPAERSEMLAGMTLYLTWDEVRSMRSDRFSFGSHTVTHPDLRSVGADQLEREVDDSIAAIRRELGSCTSFAYPFGFADAGVMATVERNDLASVLLVGSVHPTALPRRLTRSEITSSADAQIFAELEVIEPVKALLRGVARKVRRRTASAGTPA